MIETNQLSALISAFRVETEKESISPETVGKLLQDIVDLLATASTDAERQILDDWKTMSPCRLCIDRHYPCNTHENLPCVK